MITTEGLDNIFYERAFERLIPQGYSFYVMDTTEFFSAEPGHSRRLSTGTEGDSSQSLLIKIR